MRPLSPRRPITGRRGTRHLAARIFRDRYTSRLQTDPRDALRHAHRVVHKLPQRKTLSVINLRRLLVELS